MKNILEKKRLDKKRFDKKAQDINKFFLFIVVVFLVYILDRYTKFLSQFIRGCFIFCMKRSLNYGAAFNLLQGFLWTRALLIIIALIVLIFTAYFCFKIRETKPFHFGLIFLFAGTLCNLIDRVVYGYVIDWLTFSFLPVPAFNIADLSNLIGVLILIVVLLKKK